jgi:hypothetical protein
MKATQRFLAAIAAALLCALPAAAQQRDSLVQRVERLVNAGDRAAALALADSALTIRTSGTAGYVEALYARGFATDDALAAERDYLRVAIEYPLSTRAEAAMRRVAEFKMARGDRPGARQFYERLSVEYSESPQAARTMYWAGRLALEDGEPQSGCVYLSRASDLVNAEDLELTNQINYLRTRCMQVSTGAQGTPAAPPPSADSVRTARPPAGSSPGFSVQVAAYNRRSDADALSRRLKARGFDVRVAGSRAPYRVRIGRYETKADATAALGRIRGYGVRGIVVEAEPAK